MKLLPYVDDKFAGYRNKSVQDFRFALSEGNALKQAFSQNMSHL